MTDLARTLRARLTAIGDPVRAAGQQAYMKSAMPYLGVSAVPLRQVCRDVFKGLSWANKAAWQADVLALWRGAKFREERYAAIELSGVRAARTFQHMDALTMYEEMIVDGAWWDYVDPVAGGYFWTLLRDDRKAMTRAMRKWSRSADIWKRRSAIICQLRAKRDTDLDLLYYAIEGSIDSREFFLGGLCYCNADNQALFVPGPLVYAINVANRRSYLYIAYVAGFVLLGMWCISVPH